MSERDQLEALLEFLLQTHGFDFSGYKRPSLERRIGKRMQELRLETYEQYHDYLEVHPEEFQLLFDTILINVTSFFRDRSSWEFLRDTVVTALVQETQDASVIRVWSAGCATGQEAYSLAILLVESMGVDAFQQRVKIYGTDVDDAALAQARLGVYTAKELETLPEALREQYFESQNGQRSFRADLRRSVIFGRHDLVLDAPISRLDLLVCRNTLMYFTAETQAQVLRRLHYALNDSGMLFMGRSEMLLTHSNLFVPIDLKHRLFAKVPHPHVREAIPALLTPPPSEDDDAEARTSRLRDLVLQAAPAAQLALDASNTVVAVNKAAGTLFGLGQKDVGRRLQDIELSYRPVELRSLVKQAHREQRAVRVSNARWRPRGGDVRFVDVVVAPLIDGGGLRLGTSVSFIDKTEEHSLAGELDRAKQELETAYGELQSTAQELETTNEELQSAVEELETTNEELQSANEELETMNEELQSTNGELQVINLELRDRGDELDRLQSVTGSVLLNLQVGVIVVDADMRVIVWNGRSEDMWGLRSDEVRDRPLQDLDLGLPVMELQQAITACLNGANDVKGITLSAMNRRGRTRDYHVSCRPLLGERQSRDGVVIVVEELEADPAA